jgi:hypothetical protein
MTGKIQIEFMPDVPVSLRKRVESLSGEFRAQGIGIAARQALPNAEQSVLIRVEEMGDISDTHITALLNAIFDGRELKGKTVILKDDERTFDLPGEMPECVDWFMIEP